MAKVSLLDGIPGIPKIIKPKQHAVLDALTAGAFLVVAGVLWNKNRRGGIAALVNGAFVAGMSALTDYNGSGKKPISFRTHGRLDEVQAVMAAAAPTVLGFERGSAFFRGQAANELMVVAMTDWDAGESLTRRLRRVA
jgi:hypothetical protein